MQLEEQAKRQYGMLGIFTHGMDIVYFHTRFNPLMGKHYIYYSSMTTLSSFKNGMVCLKGH
jgi:hypothetical protein